MDAHGGKLQQHPLVEVQVVDLEVGSACAADQHVVREPAVDAVALIGAPLVADQTEHALIVAQVGTTRHHAANVAVAAGDDGSDQLVPDLQRLAGGIALDVLAEVHHLAGSLVTQHDGNESERILTPLVHVGAADACALHADKNIVVGQFGNGNFLDLKLLGCHQHSAMRDLGQVSGICGGSRTVAHALYDLADNFFNLRSRYIHDFQFLSVSCDPMLSFPRCPEFRPGNADSAVPQMMRK